ncbi:MAG TPA: TetR/AcrR family transcriptional regulator, partial [Xanthobacteraceae bacterium]|nr:TetR/AcrR family transcriptional regulator [Xanthobacteraceae bacterium]
MKPKIRPRTKPPQQRRDELMDAAQRLFLKQGVASTTIEEIASGADIAKGTFYLHFSSRDDLLVALGEQFANRHLGRITAAIARKPEADWIAKLAT